MKLSEAQKYMQHQKGTAMKTLTSDELLEWNEKLFGNSVPGTRWEQIQRAGAIARASGQRVEINAFSVVPDKSEEIDWGWIVTVIIAVIVISPFVLAGISLVVHGGFGP